MAALYYYYAMLAVSIVMTVVYAYIFHKHFDPNITIITVLVPIINLGFVLMGHATIIEEALIALRLTYLGGCFLLVSAMFLIFNICEVKLPAWLRATIIAISCGVYATTLTIGHIDIFYKGMPTLAFSNGAAYITDKHYGFMHTVFYVMVIVYYLVTIGVIVYSFFRKRQVPRTILVLMILSVTIAMVGFFGGRFITAKIELLPVTYNLGMIIYLIMASRLRLYDASDSVTDSLVQKGETGFISFDHKMRFLGCNERARMMFPEIKNLTVDKSVASDPWASKHFVPWIEAFIQSDSNDKQVYEKDGATYVISINRLIIGKMNRGFQLLISDDTANQEHIRLIHSYNKQLEEEVAKKTQHILDMQNRLVLGMATMVEGRDNSTGGHIKRTSDCIKILVREMQKDNYPGIDEQFAKNLIQAAPMHDLGKITIDDAILRKPGRFTPEEFAVMKTHAAEGAKIIHEILEGTDDTAFQKIAENVAHYHHERWDGSGYPKGLKGEEIPLEARIMAIVDVYDALVSKRVYKERMSFIEADAIITEGMGKHFDKALEPYYIKAKPLLEAYYNKATNE